MLSKVRRGFSLVELVIVLVIIGVIAAIAIPRMTRGATNAAATALRGDLQVLRNAIELYRAEHDGAFPELASFSDQMTKYTRIDGSDPSDEPSNGTGRIYGPYLAAVPSLPVGTRKGSTGVATADGANVGWIYDEDTGSIRANTDTEADQNGTAYNTY